MNMHVPLYRKLKNARNCHTTIFDVCVKLNFIILSAVVFSLIVGFLAIEFKLIEFGMKSSKFRA